VNLSLKNISCVHCGGRVYTVPALEPGGSSGDIIDYIWLCGQHRAAMKNLLGESVGQSPGRPVVPRTPTERARALRTGRHRSRGQAPVPPSMPRPLSSRPGSGAPSMPRPRP
jgi:hypothetical protein